MGKKKETEKVFGLLNALLSAKDKLINIDFHKKNKIIPERSLSKWSYEPNKKNVYCD